MTIEVLQKDMIAAMKAKDKQTKDAVSSLIAAVKKVAIDEGTRENIPEALIRFRIPNQVYGSFRQLAAALP